MFFSLISNAGIATLTPWDFFTPPYQWQFHALLPRQILLRLHLPCIYTTFSPPSFQLHGQLGSHVKHSYSGLDHNIGNTTVTTSFNPPSGAAGYKDKLTECRDNSRITQNVLFMTKSKGDCEINATFLQWMRRYSTCYGECEVRQMICIGKRYDAFT